MTWVLKTLENEQKQSVHGKEIILERDNSDLKKKKKAFGLKTGTNLSFGAAKILRENLSLSWHKEPEDKLRPL